MESGKFYRVIGAIVIVLGLYFVVWGKRKDYKPPSNESALPAKQTPQEGNTRNEHCTHEVITVSMLGAGITTRDEQV